MAKEMAIRYQINDGDTLVYVNDAWQKAVIADGYLELQADYILRRNLFDFITDSTTRMLYRDLLQQVRGGRSLKLSFRCDTPAQRRWMEMAICLTERRMVEFSIYLLRCEERLLMPLLDPTHSRSDALLYMCSWCKQVRIEPNQWVEIEKAVITLHLFDQPLLPELSHGICPRCLASLTKKIR